MIYSRLVHKDSSWIFLMNIFLYVIKKKWWTNIMHYGGLILFQRKKSEFTLEVLLKTLVDLFTKLSELFTRSDLFTIMSDLITTPLTYLHCWWATNSPTSLVWEVFQNRTQPFPPPEIRLAPPPAEFPFLVSKKISLAMASPNSFCKYRHHSIYYISPFKWKNITCNFFLSDSFLMNYLYNTSI